MALTKEKKTRRIKREKVMGKEEEKYICSFYDYLTFIEKKKEKEKKI